MTAVLAADYPSGTLHLLQFDARFGSLSVSASASIEVPIRPGSVIESDPATGFGLSPVLLAADARLERIVVGNRFSTRLVIFRRSGRLLERAGQLELDGPPLDLSVSPDGRQAAVLAGDGKSVALLDLFRSMGGESSGDGALAIGESGTVGVTAASGELSPGGREAIRKVQRVLGELGYPIGVIDGYAGQRTQDALRAAEAQSGMQLDMSDINATVETLESLKSR